MKKSILALVFGLVFLLPISVKAAFFRASESGIENIGREQTLRNAYIAGSTINIDSDIQKDLFAAGSTINVNGKVEDDLTVAGNNISVKGPIGGSARMAGSMINIDNRIGEDLLVAVNEMILSDKSIIAGDLVFAANKAEVKGEVGGDVKLVGAEIIISGVIRGNVLIKDVNKLTITDSAQIEGKLTYNSPNEATIEDGSRIAGGVDFKRTNANRSWPSYGRKASVSIALYQLVGTILLLLLFAYLSPKLAKRFTDQSFSFPFKNFIVGLIVLIVTPIISLILLVVSFKLTLVAMLIYFLFLVLASSFSALLIGSWVLKAFQNAKEYTVGWQSVVLGAVLAAALAFIPFIGAVLLFVLLLIAFGSLLTMSYESLTK